mmetsp:Transcript_79622/g.234160  ORF Transcript_79622/g.234160 Transcript_79622/m.234160 type:complete len:203 (+) Transcript_79622:1193-1801(+)
MGTVDILCWGLVKRRTTRPSHSFPSKTQMPIRRTRTFSGSAETSSTRSSRALPQTLSSRERRCGSGSTRPGEPCRWRARPSGIALLSCPSMSSSRGQRSSSSTGGSSPRCSRPPWQRTPSLAPLCQFDRTAPHTCYFITSWARWRAAKGSGPMLEVGWGRSQMLRLLRPRRLARKLSLQQTSLPSCMKMAGPLACAWQTGDT